MKNKYSGLQYFLWLISGSEISILKKCPTDYNRHAGIGFTILMTSLFGSFAGGYAGFYFTKSYLGAIIFGIVWGLLIFSIDRTMVISMKKKPQDKAQNYVGQVFARAILAALIAFIISIPLELLVFKDNIDAGLSLYKVNKQTQLANSLDSLYKPKQDSIAAAKESTKADSLERVSISDPQDASFKQLVAYSNQLQAQNNTLNSESNAFRNKAVAYRLQSYFTDEEGNSVLNKRSGSYQNYLTANSNANAKRKEALRFLKDKRGIDSDISQKRENHKRINEQKTAVARKSQQRLDSIGLVKGEKIDSSQTKFETSLRMIDSSFSVRFDVLTFLSKKRDALNQREFPSIFFLLWLIRILFFIIEILPTVTKVMTPFGAYDMALFQEEENLRLIKLPAAAALLKDKVNIDQSIELDERRRQQQYRIDKEGQLHDSLVDRIVTTQNTLAKKILDDWEKENGTVR